LSRIDNTTLQLYVTNQTVGNSKSATVRVYATNYNVLRVISGMGGKQRKLLQSCKAMGNMLCRQVSQQNLRQVCISA
jgi:hypothetical protein